MCILSPPKFHASYIICHYYPYLHHRYSVQAFVKDQQAPFELLISVSCLAAKAPSVFPRAGKLAQLSKFDSTHAAQLGSDCQG